MPELFEHIFRSDHLEVVYGALTNALKNVFSISHRRPLAVRRAHMRFSGSLLNAFARVAKFRSFLVLASVPAAQRASKGSTR